MSRFASLAGCTLRLVAACMPDAAALRFGGPLGAAFHDYKRRDRERAQRHLAHAFPGSDPAWIRRTARQVFQQIGRNGLTMITWLNREPGWITRRLHVRRCDRPHLRALLHATVRGEGSVLAGSHFGNWEGGFRAVSHLHPTATVAKRLRSPLADQLVTQLVRRVDDQRRRIFAQEDGLRGPMRWLRDGKWMCLLHDQDISRIPGTHVPWFGIPAYTPIGPASLAVATGSAMQTVLALHDGRRWIIHFGPRWYPDRTRPKREEIQRLTARVTADLEGWVRRHPTQWVWWHKRWRTRPS